MTETAKMPRRAARLAGLLLLAACGPSSAAPVANSADFETARQQALKLQEDGAPPEEQLEALLAAHRLDPAHAGINRRLGRVYTDLRRPEEALAAFQRVLLAQPDDHETLMATVTVHVWLARLDEALALLPALLADPQFAGEARYQKALVLDQQGRREEAEALVAETQGLSAPQAFRCHSLRGRYLSERGDWAGASAEFARALAGRPDYKEALRGAADCARRLGRGDEARRWDARLALFVELTDSVYAQSARLEKPRRAILEKLVADYPAWGDGFLELAALQQRAGDQRAACRTVEAYLAAHGAGVPADQRAALRKRFCEGGA